MAGAVGPEFRGARRRLIETLQGNGITDLAVLRSFDLVPRHAFVPTGVAHRAYVLQTGRVIKSGPASVLLEDPDVKKAYLGG